MSDPKTIQIRKDVNSRIQIRVRIRYYLKVGYGSVIDWKVGSESEINSFGSATLVYSQTFYTT